MSEQENGGFTPNENETQQTPETADPQNSEYHFTGEDIASRQASFGSGDWQTAPGQTPHQPQPKKKKGSGKKILLGCVAVLAAAAICFGAGYAGAQMVYQNKNRVVLQQVTASAGSGTVQTASGALTGEQIAAKVEDSVVAITTEIMTKSNYWFGSYVASGAGSGVIISEDGYILTAAHVISGASKITVELRDGTTYPATVVGSYVNGDIAVVKIEATGLKAAEVADSSQVKQGAACYAVGNPEGRFSGSISDGIVSALDRTISVQVENSSQSGQTNRGSLYDMFYGGFGSSTAYSTITLHVIQMTAAVSPGNSGGALFNDQGQLIGIVSAKSSDSDSEGLGFAIPSNTAMEIASQLIANGSYEAPESGDGEQSGVKPTTNKAILGITVQQITAQQAAQYNMTAGVYISGVSSQEAKDAGLQVGDRIISVDEVMVSQSSDVTDYLAGKQPGDTVEVNVEREGKLVSADVTLQQNTDAQ